MFYLVFDSNIMYVALDKSVSYEIYKHKEMLRRSTLLIPPFNYSGKCHLSYECAS